MRDSCWLIVSKKGINSRTLYKNSPPLEVGEIRIKINVNVPDIVFDTPAIEGTLTLTEEQARDKIIKELDFELTDIKSRE